jgi:hypothetical protein
MGMIKRTFSNGTVHWKIREICASQAGFQHDAETTKI